MSQFVFYPQQDPDDCGVSVLRMVARYHGLSVSAKQIREASGVPYGELSLLALSRAAESIGLDALSVRLTADQLDQLIQLPAVAHTQGQHYVLIEKITSRDVYLSDPAYGRYALTKTQFQERWGDEGKGILLALEPGKQFVPVLREDETPSSRHFILPTLDRKTLALLLVECVLLLVFLQLFSSLSSLQTLQGSSLALVGGFCLVSWTSYALLRGYWTTWVTDACEGWISQLDQRNEATFMHRVDLEGDVDGAFHWIAKRESRSFLLQSVRHHLWGIRSGVLTVTIGFYLLWQFWLAGGLYFFCVAGVWLWMIQRKKRMLGQSVLTFERAIGNRLHTWVKEMGNEWQVDIPANELEHPSGEATNNRWASLYWLLPLGWFLVLVWGVVALHGHSFPVDGLALAGILGFYGLRQWVKGHQAGLVENMLLPGYEGMEMAQKDPPSDWLADGIRLLEGGGYPEAGKAQSLHFPGGASVLVFGEDNPARTMVLHQLAGNVSGEDRKLATMTDVFDKNSLIYWRKTRMVIRHTSVLPVAPVGAMITGRSDFVEGEPALLEALEGSLLREMIQSWPDGLQTVLSYQAIRGHALSHQILIARALYLQPEWLIVDEVFRHLDPFREQVILENVVHARQGMNTILFSRRLEMTGLVDWIIHLREGAVLEEGSLLDLLKEEGYLYSLITST
ncbi:MAG: hypothetical protein K9I85_00570 [Saprospiraceae bacterium]|nr:hypothetical protein [Saprospiraceae bacterium]